MDLLLDTHTFLWFSEDSQKLSYNAETLIEDKENRCFISIASIWEMAVKVSLGKLVIANGFPNLLEEIEKRQFIVFPIKFEHTVTLTELKFYHRDPFDRLLLAQAKWEGFTLISNDTIFDEYEVKRKW